MTTNEILMRFHAMNSTDGRSIDAIAKSLRCYETELHPLLRERLLHYDQIEDDLTSISRSTSYRFNSDTPWLGNNFMNYLFQSFFDQEEPDFESIIYVKCSRKTLKVVGENINMETYIKGKLASFHEIHRRAMSLREFVTSELGAATSEELFQEDYAETLLSTCIGRFMKEHSFKFPVDQFVVVPGREKVIPFADLVMSSRYYATRQDNRAFCIDRNAVRHLSGSCLHRLLLPQDMRQRKGLHRNHIIPAYDKDKLDITLRWYPGRSHFLIQGDVSNFTGSAANAWVILHIFALQLSEHGSWDKSPNLYSIKGSFLTATWRDVIITYLYSTVGVACMDEDGQPRHLPGGFLGVAGNMSLGLLLLAMCLRNLEILCGVVLDDIVTQAGGDDFIFLISGNEHECQETLKTIKLHVTQYVGRLKEWNVVQLDQLTDGYVEDIRYCRKRVSACRTGSAFHIYTNETVPIPECLLRCGMIKDQLKRQEAWQQFNSALVAYDERHPRDQLITNTLRKFFFTIYPDQWPARIRRTTKLFDQCVQLVKIGEVYLTKEALDKVNNYQLVVVGSVQYLTTAKDCIRHALKSGDLMMYTVSISEEETITVITTLRSSIVKSKTEFSVTAFNYDADLLAQLIHIYNN